MGRAIRSSRLHVLDDRWPDRLAVAVLTTGLFSLLVTIVPTWRRFFDRPADPVSLMVMPIVPNLIYPALLIVVAVALRRRLRAAWWFLLLWWVLVPQTGRVLALIHSPRHRDAGPRPQGLEALEPGHRVLAEIGLVLGCAVIVLLLLTRSGFTARRVPGSLRAALTLFLTGGAVILTGGAWLVQKVGDAESYPAAAGFVAGRLLADLGRLEAVGTVSAPWWVHLLLNLLGAAVVLTSALLLFRPPRGDHRLPAADEARVRTLLAEHGEHDSLGYFATRRDKAMVWDTGDPATARAGISHRVVGTVSLASGNPVGDPEHWDRAIEAWRRLAREQGLSLAVMGAGEEGGRAYAEAGLVVYDIGDEAVLALEDFTLSGPAMHPVRRVTRRLHDEGWSVDVRRQRDLTAAELDAIVAGAGQWRGDGGEERGFSMALGRLGDPLDGDCLLALAHDPDGRLRAVLGFVPWGATGASLDLMRRDPSAANGVVELLVTTMAEQAPGHGVGRLSLNFAMFREVFERGAEIGAGPLDRLWLRGLRAAGRTWQLESLYRANAKYRPTWEPRYLCFELASDLPRVGVAAGTAEGFLRTPGLLARGRRGAVEAGPEALVSDGAEHAAAVRALMPEPADPLEEALAAQRLPEQVRVRLAKLAALRAEGIDPYPVGIERTSTLAAAREAAAGLGADARSGHEVRIAGRVMRRREHGRIGFATLRDGSGDLQVMIADAAEDTSWEVWRRLDLGDQIAVRGELITTRTGEVSVDAAGLVLTAKSLRPLPDKHHGLSDPEARVRERAVDLVVRPDARTTAYQRATVVRSVRDTLHELGFTEVETPVLQAVHGGASARPFETHINAYDMDLFLRIATELHLKRLVVGGMEQVFEIGRQFRNEGADASHNPEFTSLEVYEAYSDQHGMRRLTQRIIQDAARAVHGAPIGLRPGADGRLEEFDLSGDWPVVPLTTAVSRALGEEVEVGTPATDLHAHARRIGLELDPRLGGGAVLEELYGALCEGSTTTPVFYTGFPRENAPLARPDRDDPRLAEKWDLVIQGSEQGTAYSELNDPVDQRRRLVAQSLLAAAGDPEAMAVDEDFLRVLELGMPPTGGMGMGIDRLVMNLTGLSIRDTILFPLTKPRSPRGNR